MRHAGKIKAFLLEPFEVLNDNSDFSPHYKKGDHAFLLQSHTGAKYFYLYKMYKEVL